MAENHLRISLLPDAVRKRLSSSCQITSIESVIEGLLTNALDADARSITIDADFAGGCVTCCDDGSGIREVEFSEQGNLAKVHCTSKLNISHHTYGQAGRFLSNLSSMCLLSVSSQHRDESSANRLVFHRGVVVNRQVRICKEEVGLMTPGTRIMVHHLFGDVPVRFKQMSLRYSTSPEIEKGFDRVRVILVGYLLAYPRLVDLRFSTKSEKQQTMRCISPALNSSHSALESVTSILFQAKYLSSLDRKKWRAASVRSSQVSIRAAISMEPSPSKETQFISIGVLPIHRGSSAALLFDTIDHLFEASTFGILQNDSVISSNGRVPRKCTDAVKGVDRWPLFYMRIDTKSEESARLFGHAEVPADQVPALSHLTKAVESLFSQFLITCGFGPEPRIRGPRRARRQKDRNVLAVNQMRFPSQDAELCRTAAEARFLSHWHRVKSARPSDEDFRYGLGFKKRVQGLSPPEDLTEDDLPLDDSVSRQCESLLTDHDRQTHVPEATETENNLPWSNPQTGRVIHLNPRTGAIMSYTPQNMPGPERCCIPAGVSHHFNRLSESLYPSSDAVKPRAVTFESKIQKYLGMTSLQQTDAPIARMDFRQLAALEGRPMDDGAGTGAVGFPLGVNRRALSAARTVQQVDRKFVLAVVHARVEVGRTRSEKRLVVLVDQHAADERIKFEELCAEFCNRSSVTLSRPLIFEIDEAEARLFEEHESHFLNWGLTYGLKPSRCAMSPAGLPIQTIEVTALPSLIAERYCADPKLLIDTLRREVWSGRTHLNCSTTSNTCRASRPWWSQIANCPQGMVEMLKSRSCRTAIMFNDVLDAEQCRKLVCELARCNFPFQCAHGRPTLTVIAELDGADVIARNIGVQYGFNDLAFGYGEAWGAWFDID